jgi:hypothetical protein
MVDQHYCLKVGFVSQIFLKFFVLVSDIQSEELVEQLREDVRPVVVVPAIMVSQKELALPELDADLALALQLQQEFDRERAELEVVKAETHHKQYTKVILDSDLLLLETHIAPRSPHRWDADNADECSEDDDSDEEEFEEDFEENDDEEEEEEEQSNNVVWKTKHDAEICGLRNTEYLEETHPQHNLGNLENIKVRERQKKGGFF